MPCTARQTRIRVPAETVLTARVLMGAGRKLTDAELADVIEALIEEIDRRGADVDLEPEAEDRASW